MSEEQPRPHGWRPDNRVTHVRYGKEHRKLRQQVLAEEPSCRRCGRPSQQADHIRPISLGGPTVRANYQALCEPCSRSKTGREGALIRHHGKAGALKIMFGGGARPSGK
jgi:5-methylcytosine-specific restriction protein A